MYRFKLPDIGEGLSEAELLEWAVAVGDRVEEGQTLAVISTDKVNVELPSPAAGTVTERHGEIGEVIDVGTVIVVIDDGRDREAAGDPEEPEATAATAPTAEPEAASAATEAGPVKAAPIARRRASELGVDLSTLAGSGPGGQVLLADVEAAAEGDAPGRRLRLTGARRAAARRLAESARTLATTSMSFELPADGILEAAAAGGEGSMSPVVPIAQGVVRTLGEHPVFNASLGEGELELVLHDAVHLGLAVHSEQGLLVPVIRNAHTMDRAQLASALSATADKARKGDLALEDIQGGTFTLSSTGGLEQAPLVATTPVINLPNVATLWVSRIRTRPRVVDGGLEAGPMLCGTLAFDHRFIHGADGVAFINALARNWRFETPRSGEGS